MNFLSSQPSIKEVATPEIIDTDIPNLKPAMSKVEPARKAIVASQRLVVEMERKEAERLKMRGLLCQKIDAINLLLTWRFPSIPLLL